MYTTSYCLTWVVRHTTKPRTESGIDILTQDDKYGVRIRSFTSVYDVVYDRLHAFYAPYTTVFRRFTRSCITVVYLRDRIWRDTEKNGDRIRSVFIRKRPFVIVYGAFFYL